MQNVIQIKVRSNPDWDPDYVSSANRALYWHMLLFFCNYRVKVNEAHLYFFLLCMSFLFLLVNTGMQLHRPS